jgi:hypothetical protein
MARTAFISTRALSIARVAALALALLAFTQVELALGDAPAATMTATTPADGTAAVTIEQCATSTVQAERSATFTAQMTATSATQRMGMRFELQQRMRGEAFFHTIVAPGLGTWHVSEPGVKIYKYVKQVTNLAAPAAYRVVVRFRWQGDKGHVIKRLELHTSRCVQPTLPGQVTQTQPPPASLA